MCLYLNNSPSKLIQMLFGSCLEGDSETRMSNKLIGRKKNNNSLKGRLPASRQSMQGYILTYSRL